jgi:hypothetical protein
VILKFNLKHPRTNSDMKEFDRDKTTEKVYDEPHGSGTTREM